LQEVVAARIRGALTAFNLNSALYLQGTYLETKVKL